MLSGFSLYARHVIDGRDRHRLERLRHYILSLEPVAQFVNEAILPLQF
jgi:hypothetical protein